MVGMEYPSAGLLFNLAAVSLLGPRCVEDDDLDDLLYRYPRGLSGPADLALDDLGVLYDDIMEYDDYDDLDDEDCLPSHEGDQRSTPRIKRLLNWYADGFGTLALEDGTRRKVAANHARGWYNRATGKRNYGQKPRTRIRRGGAGR